MINSDLYFVFPGNLNTNTGGYHYDRRLILELQKLGKAVKTISLSEKFPFPDASALKHANDRFSSIPDDSTVIVDGLAFGAMKSVTEFHKNRLRLIGLCHHPLALETGLGALQKKLFLKSEAHALQCARHIIVTSENTRKILIEDFFVAISKITVAMPGTDTYPFANCNGSPPKLLTCASFTQRKGHDVLIDAFNLLKDLSWTARFVGDQRLDPAWTSSLKRKISASHLEDRVEFVGTVKNLSNEYQNADIFILPSRFEGYGMVLSEALAHGLPIVSTYAGAIPDVVPESAGILVAPGDYSELATALKSIIMDQSLRMKMQMNAQKIALNLPSWNRCAEIILHGMEAASQK